GKPTTDLVHELAHQGVKLNVTALFTLNQIFSVCQALKGGAPSVVSVFAGRIADTGRDPIPTMKAALEMCRSMDKNMELLWASTRELYNIVQADQIGCDIITVPFDLIKKMPMLGQDLVEMSLDTVKTFKKDADSAGFKL
ncbi:transaldolase, partial [bacterium]|nr:transaldolase [bacterium]